MNTDKKCDCGGKLTECEFIMGMAFNAQIKIPNGYNFPKIHSVQPYVCEECGKITFFAKKEK